MKDLIKLKTKEEIKIMEEGGRKLARVKKELVDAVKIGGNALELDQLAEDLILKSGGKPSFKMVPGYRWTTCININDGVVHGIPKKTVVFNSSDVVSIDVGMFYKNYHTDTSITIAIDPSPEISRMLTSGKEALKDAIAKATVGNRIYDIDRKSVV